MGHPPETRLQVAGRHLAARTHRTSNAAQCVGYSKLGAAADVENLVSIFFTSPYLWENIHDINMDLTALESYVFFFV